MTFQTRLAQINRMIGAYSGPITRRPATYAEQGPACSVCLNKSTAIVLADRDDEPSRLGFCADCAPLVAGGLATPANVKSIDVFLVDTPSEDFDSDLQLWLAQEYDIDAVSVSVERDSYGRSIVVPFAIVWLYNHPNRTHANELKGQQAVAVKISERVGYPVPLWSANPFHGADHAR